MSQDVQLVATLIAGCAAPLYVAQVKTFAAHIEKCGGASVRTAWLADGIAADVFFTAPLTGSAFENETAQLAGKEEQQPFDVIVQPVAARRKKLLVADMKSTIIEQEMLDEMADFIGLRAETAEITRRGMNGELDFPASLRERTALFKGRPVKILEEVARRVTTAPGAETLVATMRANGAICLSVTGGFSFFVQPVVEKLGFHEFFANDIVLKNGVMTGEVAEPILDKNAKKTLLQQACAQLKISLREALAVGDGANDVPMLNACNEGGGLGVAYHAKPKVREVIPHQVNHGDMTALLYAQGYSKI